MAINEAPSKADGHARHGGARTVGNEAIHGPVVAVAVRSGRTRPRHVVAPSRLGASFASICVAGFCLVTLYASDIS
jgi:hypothetical protein